MSSTPAQARYTRYNIMWSSMSVTGRWFSAGTPVSCTNKIDLQDIAETLLKVELNIINPKTNQNSNFRWIPHSNLTVMAIRELSIFVQHSISNVSMFSKKDQNMNSNKQLLLIKWVSILRSVFFVHSSKWKLQLRCGGIIKVHGAFL